MLEIWRINSFETWGKDEEKRANGWRGLSKHWRKRAHICR